MKQLGTAAALAVVAAMLLAPSPAQAHCQIPCGIYNDSVRFVLLAEDITTIEKSMNQITELSGADPINYNQLVRWVSNKEAHADKFMEIVTQYFMAQRIKTDATDYEQKVTLLHQMLVYAMKCKQTTDLANTTRLRELLKEFETLYFGG